MRSDTTENRVDVREISTWRVRLPAAALAVIMAILVSMNCFAAEMTSAEKACCVAMSHDCGRLAQQHECCRSEAPRVDQSSAVSRISIAAPVATVIGQIATDLVPHSLLRVHRDASSASPVRPPGLPTYLLVSSLRL